jgi:hypothetical protein
MLMNVWTYRDSAGNQQRGALIKVTDRGGTDITYWFHRLTADNVPTRFENGGFNVDLVSGEALKQAGRIGNLPLPEGSTLGQAKG